MLEEKNKLSNIKKCNDEIAELLKILEEKNINIEEAKIVNSIIVYCINQIIGKQTDVVSKLFETINKFIDMTSYIINHKDELIDIEHATQIINYIKFSNEISFEHANNIGNEICKAISDIRILIK